MKSSSLQLSFQENFKRIDHYQFLQLLGKGANGLVYKGLNTQNGSFVAIKQMIIGKSQMKTIKSQLTFLKKLEHPSIVRYIDAIQKQNRIYLILQYIQGGSLGALAKKSKLQEDVIKLYIKQVLVGLEFLHKQGVIHRDIKGANILITKHGKVKLADFGVAIRIQESQKTISAAGSPYWIAPQIIIGELEPSTKCDIWSVGCTVIQLLTGNPPYFDLMQFPALFRIVEDQHPPLPECSQQCRSFLLKCFTKNPLKRPNSQQLQCHIWLKSVQKQPKITKICSEQNSSHLQVEIQKAFIPHINYEKILQLIQQTEIGQNIYRHPYFYNILENKSLVLSSSIVKGSVDICENIENKSILLNSHHHSGINHNHNYRKERLQIILKIIKNNPEGLHYLQNIGLIPYQCTQTIKYLIQMKNFYEKQISLSITQKKQQSLIISTITQIIEQVIKTYIQSLQNQSQSMEFHTIDSYCILSCILKSILPMIGKICWYLSQPYTQLTAQHNNIRYRLIRKIYQIVVVMKHKNVYETNNCRINIENLCQIFSTVGIIQQINQFIIQDIVSKNNSSNVLVEICLLKLQILLKIVPSLAYLSAHKPKYQQYLKKIIQNLFRNNLISSNLKHIYNVQITNQIIVGRLLLVNQLSNSMICRALLQRSGYIYQLSIYYSNINQKINNIGVDQCHQFLLILQGTTQFIYQQQQNMRIPEINRIIQLTRYNVPDILGHIYRKINRNMMERDSPKFMNKNGQTINLQMIGQKIWDLLRKLEQSVDISNK